MSRKLDIRLVRTAIAVGSLCAVAGIWQSFTGDNMILAAALVWTGCGIAGVLWWHLLNVHDDQKRQ